VKSKQRFPKLKRNSLNFSISNTAQWSIFSNIQDTFVLVVKIKLKEQTFSDKFNIFELH
jgi:hypothetical protein